MPLKILIISPKPTHPTNSGTRARILHLAAALRRAGHDVHLLHIELEAGDVETMQTWWDGQVSTVPYSRPRRRIVHRLLRRVMPNLKASPDWLDRYYRSGLDDLYTPDLSRRMADVARRHTFDAVLVNYVFLTKALESFGSDVLKVVDTHDVYADRHKVFWRRGLGDGLFTTSPQDEARGLGRADVVMAIQEKERSYFSSMLSRKVITVGHLGPLDLQPVRRGSAHRLLFLGAKTLFNVEGLQYFFDEVWPLVRVRHPRVELLVAGKVGSETPRIEGVHALGVVDDLAGAYADADVVINPQLNGTGLAIKSIEALGYGKPLVAAPAGARGLEDGAPTALLIAETAEKFADYLTEILTHETLRRDLSLNGYRYAVEHNRRSMEALLAVLETRRSPETPTIRPPLHA